MGSFGMCGFCVEGGQGRRGGGEEGRGEGEGRRGKGLRKGGRGKRERGGWVWVEMLVVWLWISLCPFDIPPRVKAMSTKPSRREVIKRKRANVHSTYHDP